MTGLAERLARQIRAAGPLTIADYMVVCLTDPDAGYYTTRDPMGSAGDFITAPEISQMFGEMLGLALAQSWVDQGRPSPFALVELGPGRGTLIADVLRVTEAVPGFHDSLDLWLVEASPVLRAAQKQAVAPFEPRYVSNLDDLPELPLFLVANEFFDALPVRQFLRDGVGWRERVVGLDDQGELCFGLTDAAPVGALAHRLDGVKAGDMVELNAAGQGVAYALGLRLAAHGGVALIVDYGHSGDVGDTFQAVRAHEKVHPLDAPGQADLTALVDFAALAGALPDGALAHGPVGQGAYLERLGITARAQALAAGLSGEALDAHIAAHRRLTHPEEMGSLFKVMALTQRGVLPPPGFDL